MRHERVMVTGAGGCIGLWTIRECLRRGIEVWALDIGMRDALVDLVLSPDERARTHWVMGDILETEDVENVVTTARITAIIHLASLLIPAVAARPVRGAMVNVGGMASILEIMRKHRDQLRSLVYASSSAVFGDESLYRDGIARNEDVRRPRSMYGVYKMTNEEMARVFWEGESVSSVGLRPYIVYGPGRLQGTSSFPSRAMYYAALGEAAEIPFGGSATYQHVEDVAAAFINASMMDVQNAKVFNLGGTTASMEQIIHAIEQIVPEIQGRLHWPAKEKLGSPSGQDGSEFDQIVVAQHWRSLEEGVRHTVEWYKKAIKNGWNGDALVSA